MFSLNQKNIVVTGSAGLIGSSICEKLRQAGANVLGFDISHRDDNPGNIFCDTTSEEQVLAAIDGVARRFGAIHGWVNNAYPRNKFWGKRPEEINMDSWAENVTLHMNSYFMCARTILEHMKKQQTPGCVINMGSIYGIQAPDFTVYEGTGGMTSAVEYAAIKGGILNLTRYLAAYYGAWGIRVNSVSPGGVFDHQNKVFVKNYEQKVPLKRMATAGDIAPSIVFLMSDEASYITGHNLVIDGGWTIV